VSSPQTGRYDRSCKYSHPDIGGAQVDASAALRLSFDSLRARRPPCRAGLTPGRVWNALKPNDMSPCLRTRWMGKRPPRARIPIEESPSATGQSVLHYAPRGGPRGSCSEPLLATHTRMPSSSFCRTCSPFPRPKVTLLIRGPFSEVPPAGVPCSCSLKVACVFVCAFCPP